MFVRKHEKSLGFAPTAVFPLSKRIFQNATCLCKTARFEKTCAEKLLNCSLNITEFFGRVAVMCKYKPREGIKSIYPTDAQLDCSKRMSLFTLKFTLKFS